MSDIENVTDTTSETSELSVPFYENLDSLEK